ncbi:MAG: hypothetical protein H7233_11155, partial [Pseudorhodobacter sp.]|nr:hypothetical protein [Frankiaceae bacterium]
LLALLVLSRPDRLPGLAVLGWLLIGPACCYSLARVLRPESVTGERTSRHLLASAAMAYAVPTLADMTSSDIGVQARVARAGTGARHWLHLDPGGRRRAGRGPVHRRLQPAAVGVRVRITWSGTCTEDDGPVRTVDGIAVTTGPMTRLRVLESHAERVSP